LYPNWELSTIFGAFMRVIATNTLKAYWEKYLNCEQALKSWLQEMENSDWDSLQALKVQYRSASVISGKRVVFNINGNKFRLITDMEFRLKIVFIVWFGTHQDYDLIDSKTIAYVKANKIR
jgi:mRNA interferase HigB